MTWLGIDHLPLFVVSGLLLNIAPGQDTFYIVGHTIAHGRRSGVFAVLGILAGCFVHTLAAAFGLSAILATSAGAYQVVKLAGAAYLIYLGVRMLTSRRTLVAPADLESSRASPGAVFRGGLLSNVLNPKTALFFLAFLPQFVSAGTERRTLAFLLLGTLFVINSVPWAMFLVWAASTMRRRLTSSRGALAIVERATGALFVGLGLRLGLSR